jgi:hypothetical protein
LSSLSPVFFLWFVARVQRRRSMFVSFVDLVFGARPANLAVCVPPPLL